ncbi:hypothetical protein [Mesorhizobium sp. M0520]|uniref:hypothetical protein n=1 Tax=Mesorhizobium sp. M0520 TaxID=2956957 RepID=UPI003337B1E6
MSVISPDSISQCKALSNSRMSAPETPFRCIRCANANVSVGAARNASTIALRNASAGDADMCLETPSVISSIDWCTIAHAHSISSTLRVGAAGNGADSGQPDRVLGSAAVDVPLHLRPGGVMLSQKDFCPPFIRLAVLAAVEGDCDFSHPPQSQPLVML